MSSFARRILSTLPKLQSEAEALMTATCVVRRKVGDEVVGHKRVPTYVVVYLGKCKPQTFRPQESTPGYQRAATVTRSEVHVPLGAFAAQVGDVITILTSRNPDLPGTHFRVLDSDLSAELQTALHLPVQRETGDDVPPWVAP